jgi:hypothetical protein
MESLRSEYQRLLGRRLQIMRTIATIEGELITEHDDGSYTNSYRDADRDCQAEAYRKAASFPQARLG